MQRLADDESGALLATRGPAAVQCESHIEDFQRRREKGPRSSGRCVPTRGRVFPNVDSFRPVFFERNKRAGDEAIVALEVCKALFPLLWADCAVALRLEGDVRHGVDLPSRARFHARGTNCARRMIDVEKDRASNGHGNRRVEFLIFPAWQLLIEVCLKFGSNR